ncbi:YgjV family protein [Georgenia wutianyii]|uniref:YgjV family protein n=1 Tax=Georgenia wutianyii TaxID=2585135 RepID=A0ABX5VQS8_9MICO|nr:YgjV family protein [Georgenia wutianyii]QDB79409.1 YgjV family protein [Georgenia wutianyii]
MFDLPAEWQVALEAVGWIGSAIVVWSMMQQRILRLRLYNLIGCLIQVLYNGVLGVWPVVALNVVLAIVQVVNLTRLLRGRDDPASYAVVDVPADGALLGGLLGRHREDIARFQPGFTQASKDADAFVVLAGDELVGAVVVHDAGDGIAQIELDYVTEKYRDFSPGRFVFGRSGVLAERGYRAVVSAPDLVEPYYEQIGFRREGERYVLDLVTAS